MRFGSFKFYKNTKKRYNTFYKERTKISLSWNSLGVFVDIVKEHTERIVSNGLQFNQPYKSIEKMADIVNITPNASIRVPHTIYKIKKMVKTDFTFQYYVECSQCKSYSTSSSNDMRLKCDSCESDIKRTISNFFVYIPLEQQIRKSLDEKFDEVMGYKPEDDGNFMTDVHHSLQFIKAETKYASSKILPFTVGTDGAVVDGSGKSLWAIQLYQNYLKPNMRYTPANIIVVGLWYGKKPNMKQFFLPLMKDIRYIIESGGIHIEKKQQRFCFMPLIMSACCDLPAKADVQEMKGHGGYYSCGYCFHPGVAIKPAKNEKSVVRYIKRAKDDPLRTHKAFLETYARLKSSPINGIKAISCMVALDDFDLANGFSIDYMHCILLGVTKKLFGLWLDSKNHNEKFYIHPKHQAILSSRIKNIRPTFEITRKPRSISDRDNFKANEYRSLLLYYTRHSLYGLLSARYIDHFQLLSSATYTLLLEKISLDDISMAECKLEQFADEFEDLYGSKNVTLNIHLLRHIGTSVRNLGPLWSQSAFGFETNNGVLVKTTAKKCILHNITWKYCTKVGFNKGSGDDSLNSDITIGGKRDIRLNNHEADAMKEIFHENTIQTVYEFAMMHGKKFGSKKSKKMTASDDFFIQTKDELYGAVQFYVLADTNLFALVIIYEIVDSVDHLIEVKPTSSHKAIEFNQIKRKMIYMKIRDKEIITAIPNRYEKT